MSANVQQIHNWGWFGQLSLEKGEEGKINPRAQDIVFIILRFTPDIDGEDAKK